jgi:hypothetical protein
MSHAAKADGKKAKLIAKYDESGNGIIDGAEMVAFRKAFAADTEGVLQGYDKDENGELSDEEIMGIKPGKSGDAEKKPEEKLPDEKKPEAKKAPEGE